MNTNVDRKRKFEDFQSLSKEEKERSVLEMKNRGMTNRQIMEEIGIAEAVIRKLLKDD